MYMDIVIGSLLVDIHVPVCPKTPALCSVYAERRHTYQWRTKGLQRPGANACIAPPPRISTPPAT